MTTKAQIAPHAPEKTALEFRVEELAEAAGVSIDTIRFYQGRGLLAAPRRKGRIALYSEEHLKQLRRIRALNHDGLPLAIIKRVLDAPQDAPIAGFDEKLLPALVKESLGRRLYRRDEFLREAAIPMTLLDAAEGAALIQPHYVEGEPRYTESDLQMLRAGRVLVEAGLPLAELVTLSRDHAHSVEEVTERAVDLFDRHIRRARADQPQPMHATRAASNVHTTSDAHVANASLQTNATNAAEAALERFHTLLPEITQLVALHFERTLIRRALQRFADVPEASDLETQLRALVGENTKE